MHYKLKNLLRIVVILVLVFANIGCDQISKNIIRENISAQQNLNYLNGHFTIMSVENKGAFLSIGHAISGPLHDVLFIALPLLFLAGLMIYLLFKPALDKRVVLATTLLIGGGIGNIYDRAVHGSVTDFMYLHWGFLHTGVFNMADISVTTGVLMLFYYSWMSKKDESSLLRN